MLPTFEASIQPVVATAKAAEAAGLDGVFAFDHLWPIGSPTRPSFAPMPVLSAVAARTESLKVGTLVARMALVGTHTLVERFLTLEALAPGRVIAGLGTGDELSKDEQIAVYDFGGGTFDLTMLTMSERELRVRATAGDMFLGGDDVDLAEAPGPAGDRSLMLEQLLSERWSCRAFEDREVPRPVIE